MGTRSLTFVYEENKPIINMYRQFDGYPEGHGAELAEFLLSGEMVNGFSQTETKQFNASNQQDFGADEKPSKPLPGLVSQSQLKNGQLSLKLGF